MISPDEISRLQSIRTFPSLVKYLRDELGWPIESDDADDLTFEYEPGELGLDDEAAVKIKDKNGATYSPRTGKYLDEMRKLKPQGFETRFIQAVNLLEMPSFVGGDPKKSQEMLLELHQKYPDSAAVAISLARAMIKNKQKKEARKVLDQVLQKDPRNLWARKVRKEIK